MNIFTAVKYFCILHGRVFVMNQRIIKLRENFLNLGDSFVKKNHLIPYKLWKTLKMLDKFCVNLSDIYTMGANWRSG